jgi:hypothetical protein
MKAKRGFGRRAWKILAGVILTPLSCFLLCAASMTLYWNEGYIQNTLPTQLLPTARALLEHPLSTPEYLTVSSSGSFCVEVNKNKMPFLSNAFLTRFVVNGVPIPHDQMAIHLQPEQYCLYTLDLLPGIHLIAIEFRYLPTQLPFSYEWTIEIK